MTRPSSALAAVKLFSSDSADAAVAAAARRRATRRGMIVVVVESLGATAGARDCD